MKLDNQQKTILKAELNKSLALLNEEPKVSVDEYVEKDFQGVELIMVLMALKKAGVYEDNIYDFVYYLNDNAFELRHDMELIEKYADKFIEEI